MSEPAEVAEPAAATVPAVDPEHEPAPVSETAEVAEPAAPAEPADDLKDNAGQGHLDWIHSDKAIQRMEAIIRGDFASHRHDLFLEREEREQCSGFRLSRLHRLSNPGYLGSGGDIDRADIDRAVIAWLIKVLEANLNTAERNLQMIMDKSIVFTYATAVLFPETFIHQQEALGYSREEAEAIFLHDEIEEDEREALRMELKEAAKEKEEQEADEQNKGEEEEEEEEEQEEEEEEVILEVDQFTQQEEEDNQRDGSESVEEHKEEEEEQEEVDEQKEEKEEAILEVDSSSQGEFFSCKL